MWRVSFGLLTALFAAGVLLSARAGAPAELRVGVAGHAFDHLGNLGEQAEAAAASGATILYATGLGGLGYAGLPPEEALKRQRAAAADYARFARSRGIRLMIGYICATSIVKLETFDRNWPPEFRTQFHTPPAAWRQQDQNGNPLPSWYGGDYQPACMNNPDWRAYEHFIVRQQLETGQDGVFFDNPTVHPQGCYCPFCLEKFAAFLKREGVAVPKLEFAQARKTKPGGKTGARALAATSVSGLRKLAAERRDDFLRFRCTIARDFLADMRAFARSVRRGALVTANNSLNSASVLYSQCRGYGYNIYEMSRAEDFVVVEDTSSQPRILSSGTVIEYGPTYQQLHAISHARPVVAVSLAEADYTTPPNLVRLAMAEAAANRASHLWWPTWPEQERARMVATIRPQAEFLRHNEELLNDAQPRRDALVFLPFRRWVETDKCAASQLAAALTRANVQYAVICEDHLATPRRAAANLRDAKVILAESPTVLNANEQKTLEKFRRQGGRLVGADTANWLEAVNSGIGTPSVSVTGPENLRAIVLDQPRRTVVHVLNLNVQRLSSFADTVNPASDVRLKVRVPFARPRAVRALTADANASVGALAFETTRDGQRSVVQFTLPRVEIATMAVIEK